MKKNDVEIEKEIKILFDQLLSRDGYKDAHIHEALKQSTKIQSLYNELGQRRLSKLTRASNNLAKIAIGVASLSIVLSAITIWFAHKDVKSDQVWQKDEINILNEINDGLESIDATISIPE